MWAPLLLLCVGDADAKPLGWFLDGASDVTMTSKRRDLELFRGPTTQYLPAVEVRVPVEGQEALRPALAVVDLCGGWSRVSAAMARVLGIEWKWTKLRGVSRRVAVIERVELDGVVLEDVHVEVVADAPGLVLGFGTFEELAVALLASEGVLRIVDAADGEALVKSVGGALDASPQPKGKWTTADGRTRRGDGLTLRVPGALRWGAVVAEGSFHLETDEPTSLVASSSRLPEPILRADEPFHDVEARLGNVWLAETWIRQDGELSDPAPDFWGALGYDVLYAIDLAVWPAQGQVAFRKARPVHSTNASERSVAIARERYAQEEERGAATGNQTVAPKEQRVQIGFDGPKKMEIPLGDPGNPVVRDRNLDLADTLWHAGELDASLPHFLAASQFAGDHCDAHLRLAEARLSWAGTKLAEDLVAKLVIDPLERAATLWDAWLDLTPQARAEITAGKDQPEGTLQVFQPERCRRARGLLVAVHRLRGDDKLAKALDRNHGARNASVAYVRGLTLLVANPVTARPPLEVGAQGDGADLVDLKVALAMAAAAEGSPDEVIRLARDVTGLPTDHPLTSAFGLVEAGNRLDSPQMLTRKIVRADDRWIPGRLVHARAHDEAPPPWDAAVERRQPGSPQVLCQRAVHLALSGQTAEGIAMLQGARFPGLADWWMASAVVHHVAGEGASRDEALLNLRLRFPLIPIGQVGLR